jgi:hypothetical protein
MRVYYAIIIMNDYICKNNKAENCFLRERKSVTAPSITGVF